MVVLRPLTIKMQPAPYDGRMKVISKIVDILRKVAPGNTDIQKTAINWEYEVAKRSTSRQSYNFNASVLLRDILKYKGNLDKYGRHVPAMKRMTKEVALEKLKGLILDEKRLVSAGYMLGPDSDQQGGVSEDFENMIACGRCSTKFKLEDIMVPTKCQFHVSRQQYEKGTRILHYSCCGETGTSGTPLSLGCKTLEHHVFREDTYAKMNKTIPFRNTKEISGEENVLALDCEMAYTSRGYELIRLTVVDFWTNKVLFDEIVQPTGEIIDLNSEFSGVHEIDRATALSFDEAVQVFLSPKMINNNSILIGHGLENDLNVLRIIHDKIIDTAVLYPNGNYKSSLKNLAFQVLSKRIQLGEHDSSEDAIAAMDVVKRKLGIPLNCKEW